MGSKHSFIPLLITTLIIIFCFQLFLIKPIFYFDKITTAMIKLKKNYSNINFNNMNKNNDEKRALEIFYV